MTDAGGQAGGQTQQGGGQTAGGGQTQAASQVGGDVRQMTIGDLMDVAAQNNMDLSPITELLNNLNMSPNVNVSGTGQAGGGAGGGQASGGAQAGGQQASPAS